MKLSPERATLLEMLGDVQTMLGRPSEGVVAYDEAMAVAGAMWSRATLEAVAGKVKGVGI